MNYSIELFVKTNYSKAELEEVMEKLFGIPEAQYEDCERFEVFNLRIKKERS